MCEYEPISPSVKVGEIVPSTTSIADGPNHRQISLIDDDTLLIADERNNKLRMFELSTEGSGTICRGGT